MNLNLYEDFFYFRYLKKYPHYFLKKSHYPSIY